MNDVVKDGVVDGSQSARSGTELSGFDAVVGFAQDGSLGKEENMFSREFLLQLTDQTALDFLEFGVLAKRNKDDIGFFVGGSDSDFFSRCKA